MFHANVVCYTEFVVVYLCVKHFERELCLFLNFTEMDRCTFI